MAYHFCGVVWCNGLRTQVEFLSGFFSLEWVGDHYAETVISTLSASPLRLFHAREFQSITCDQLESGDHESSEELQTSFSKCWIAFRCGDRNMLEVSKAFLWDPSQTAGFARVFSEKAWSPLPAWSPPSQNHGLEPWSAPPQNHGPEIPVCNHFYGLFYSPVPKEGFSGPWFWGGADHGSGPWFCEGGDHAGTGDHASFDISVNPSQSAGFPHIVWCVIGCAHDSRSLLQKITVPLEAGRTSSIGLLDEWSCPNRRAVHQSFRNPWTGGARSEHRISTGRKPWSAHCELKSWKSLEAESA